MSRWTQTPGQSKPMCEAMKRPAQELGLLSRSWGDGRSDGVGEGLHPERPQGCCCSALGEHAGPRPAPAPSATAFLGICRKAVVGEGQCPLGTQLRGTWDPEGLARALTGLPSPRRAAGKGAEGSRQTPKWGGTPEPGAVGMLAPLPLAPWTLAPARIWGLVGDLALHRCCFWGHTEPRGAELRLSSTRPTATEFFMSATAEVNSLKCSSGQ